MEQRCSRLNASNALSQCWQHRSDAVASDVFTRKARPAQPAQQGTKAPQQMAMMKKAAIAAAMLPMTIAVTCDASSTPMYEHCESVRGVSWASTTCSRTEMFTGNSMSSNV